MTPSDTQMLMWLLNRMCHQSCGPNAGWTLDELLPGDTPWDAVAEAMARQEIRAEIGND